MIFRDTALEGVSLIKPEPIKDNRGLFARTFCSNEFKANGLHFDVAQSNIAVSARKGTLRGLHYQLSPASEQKIVRCTRGAVYYVIVDVREGSPTYLQHCGFELSHANGNLLYVSPGFASGSQALEDDTEVAYMMSEQYAPGREGGFRYDDLAFGISWPLEVTALSEKDARWPQFGEWE